MLQTVNNTIWTILADYRTLYGVSGMAFSVGGTHVLEGRWMLGVLVLLLGGILLVIARQEALHFKSRQEECVQAPADERASAGPLLFIAVPASTTLH